MAAGSMTPPPPPRVRTPPAPRFGAQDSWEPFSPRKSARLSSRRAADRTPSPQQPHRRPQPASPQTTNKANAQARVAMASPTPSPCKKPQPAPVPSARQVSGTLTAEATANAAAALGLNSDKTAAQQRAPAALVSGAGGMLPTPSKTPQKPPNEKTAANIQALARNLFASEQEAMPSPRKRRAKTYSGLTMESFTAKEVEEDIPIFTDSQERVPVKDASAKNPFYGDAVPEPTKRRSKRKFVNIPGEGPVSVEEACRRDDGVLSSFRGKTFYRMYAENDTAEPEAQEEPGADVEPELTRPLTRSSIKPRLLFPRSAAAQASADEEAVTDVEDAHVTPEPQTPKKGDSAPSKTPEAPKFAPVSPPETKRTTRSANRLAQAGTPIKGSSGRKSPFDAWPRTKEHKAPSAPKRQGESLAATASKRARA